MCIPLRASILFVLPAGNHASTCRPSPSCAFYFCTSEQNHCAFHPSAITIAISACVPFCSFCLLAITPMQSSACVSHAPIRIHNSKCAPPVGHHRVALSFSAPVNKNHCAFHPSAITIAVSACAFQSVQSTHRQSTLQLVRVCPTSASATTVHCVFHLPQSELVLSISIPVNENHLCSPHNRQPDRNQCLWIPWCAFHYVLPFCSFCLLAITPMQSVPLCPTPVSETTIQSVLHLPAITGLCFLFLHQ